MRGERKAVEEGNLEKLSSWSIEIWSNQACAVIGSLRRSAVAAVKDTSIACLRQARMSNPAM
jgi:hypothetical protein